MYAAEAEMKVSVKDKSFTRQICTCGPKFAGYEEGMVVIMKKILSLIMVCTLVMALFAGCSSSKKKDQDENKGNGNKTEDTDKKSGSDEQIKLKFQYIGGTVPAQDKVINDAIAAFEDANPNIKVEPIYIDWGNGHSQFYNSVMAGTAPDMTMLGGTWCVEFLEMGTFAPIADYVPQDLIDKFIPAGFDIMKDADGTIYGLPWDGCTWGLVYRKDLFDQAGIDKVPETWDELLEAGKKMKAIDKYLFTVSCSGFEVDDYYLPFLWQAGGEVCERDENGKWVSKMDTPESLAAAEFYVKLVQEGYMPKEITGMDTESVLNSFTAGDTAMMVTGMWNIANLKGMSEMDGKWATARGWAGPGGNAVLSYPNTVHITEASQNKEAAGKFLQFFYDKGYYDDYCITSGVFSFTKDFVNSEYAQDEMLAPFIADAEYGRNRPAYSKYEEFRSMHFNPGVQAMVAGDITPEDFCKQMAEAFESLE